MQKNIKMLKIFFKVINGYFDLVIPDMYQKDIYHVNYNLLKEEGIKTILFDIDNTLLEVNSIEVSDKLIKFINQLKENFDIILMSNNSKKRVEPVAKKLNVKYLYKSGKPLKEAFDKALNLAWSSKLNTCLIGDQLLSDIYGCRSYGITSILVDPLKNKYDLKTGTSRLLQKIMLKKLHKKGYLNKYYERREDI